MSFTPGRSIVESCDDLMNRIFNDFTFDPSFSTITPVSHVFEHKGVSGLCPPNAYLLTQCWFGGVGVSGYIETIPPPGQESLLVQTLPTLGLLFVLGSGWIDYDPTNNLKPYDQQSRCCRMRFCRYRTA